MLVRRKSVVPPWPVLEEMDTAEAPDELTVRVFGDGAWQVTDIGELMSRECHPARFLFIP